ncbi:MAG TPA: PAS domain S-box protein, partial [Bryobacteraceae bacterium]|nr:PAS domain S-box protein [Bryobacteraceae bacterium]
MESSAISAQHDDRLFRVLADNAPALIWLANSNGQFVWFNRPWLDFTGRTMEQELGDGWAEGVHPDDRDRAVKAYRELFEKRTPFKLEYRLRRHDGVYRWVLDNGVPYTGSGSEFSGYMGSCIDIHDHRETEQELVESNQALRRANSDLEHFAYAASHDLKEPLRIVALYSQLLQKRAGAKLDDEERTFLEYLVGGAGRMELLVGNLLTYTRAATSPVN